MWLQEKTTQKNDFEHVRICNIMKNAGIPCTILKGFASALYYPYPLMRSMGDVDFLVDTDNFEEASKILSLGNCTGEGWFLTAEMLELIHSGAPNIVCMQPFACLPNHVTGKGMIKALRENYPDSNIVAVDYDPGASETNQTNRIKLLTTVAKDNLKRKNQSRKAIEIENLLNEISSPIITLEENVLKLSKLDYQIKTGQISKELGFEFLLLSM